MSELEQLVERLARTLDTRRWGKYRGSVVDNVDPDKLGRLRLLVPTVYGEEVSDWALPSLPFAGPGHGLFLLPEVGDFVWVEFEEGILERPIWTGCLGPRASEAPEFGRRTLATPKGHRVELVDVDDQEAIVITHCGGARIAIDSAGICIADANGNKLVMSSDGIVVEDASGNKLVTTAAGVAIEDTNSNKLVMADRGVTLDGAMVDIA